MRCAHEIDPSNPLNVTPPLYNTAMNNGVRMNDNKNLYDTLARINAALAAQKAERDEWARAYDESRGRRTQA